MSKQLFILDMPVKDLLNKISKYPVHFFSCDDNINVIIANDVQAEYFGADSVKNFIGKNYLDFASKTEIKEAVLGNIIAMNKTTPHLSYETVLGKECVCIKSKLFNSSNNVIGIGGLAFYPHQIALKDIISLVNKFICSSTANNAKYNYVCNTVHLNKLSNRERECVNCLTKSMTYKEIAKSLNISSRTVETHIEHIKNKLGCYNRSGIVSKVFETRN